MRAMRYHEFGGPELLQVDEVDLPRPGEGEVLLKVASSSVNPADWKLGEGNGRGVIDVPMPFTPGIDFSGVVLELGKNVSSTAVGDRVYGMTTLNQCGAYAEVLAIPSTRLTKAPTSIPLVTAGAVPLAALTAWNATIPADQGNVQSGQRVLIHGGAGGTGSFAVQLACWRKAHVIATASRSNQDFLCSIGAHQTIDYQQTPFEEAVRDIDVVIDLVGGDVPKRSLTVLRPGGVLVTIATPKFAQLQAVAGRQQVHATMPTVTTEGDVSLDQVGRLIDSGTLQVMISNTFPLVDAGKGLAHNSGGHAQGKSLVTVSG